MNLDRAIALTNRTDFRAIDDVDTLRRLVANAEYAASHLTADAPLRFKVALRSYIDAAQDRIDLFS